MTKKSNEKPEDHVKEEESKPHINEKKQTGPDARSQVSSNKSNLVRRTYEEMQAEADAEQ